MNSEPGEITRLLESLKEGDQQASGRVVELLYEQLRQIAARRMRSERDAHTLTPTALVHEAYLRLGGESSQGYESRNHFLALASQAMRRVLVDHARARLAHKRNGGVRTEMPQDIPDTRDDASTLALNEALDELARLSSRQAQVIEMRYFGGLTESDVADVLGVTRRTINRDWQMARAWLHARMTRGSSS